MKRVLLVLVLLALASGVYAADNQAFLGIFAETSVQKMPGMPKIELPPGVDLSNIPGAEAMMNIGAPQRKLNVRLWSPSIAPENAFAYITPPPGLKQGSKLELDLFRPKPVKGGGETSGGKDEFNPDQIKGLTMKVYWGCSDTVRPGQPKIIKWEGLTDEQKAMMKKQADKMRESGGSYYYKPDWTTGYWPTDKQPGKIAKDASLVGTFALTTNYTGNVSLDAPSNVNFLAPIDLTNPDMAESPSLDNAIPLEWKQIPNALGIYLSVVGMQGKDTIIMWSCSESEPDNAMIDWDFLQMAEVRDFVKKRVMLQGDATSCSVPAGIFKGCDMAMLRMIGYGPGAALAEGQPLPRIQTKTTLNAMLGSMKMPGMGGPGGMKMPKDMPMPDKGE